LQCIFASVFCSVFAVSCHKRMTTGRNELLCQNKMIESPTWAKNVEALSHTERAHVSNWLDEKCKRSLYYKRVIRLSINISMVPPKNCSSA
jgi:hypothetical protein